MGSAGQSLSVTSPKLLVLLGAGGSHGYGPSTQWLTERLLASRSGVHGAQLFRRVRQILKRSLSIKSSWSDDFIFDPNFEEIIQAVDDIASLLPGSRSLLTPFVRLSGALKPLKPQRKRYVRYATRAREFILRETNRFCDRSPDPRERELVKGMNSLAARSRLRVMSLNYDDLVGAAGIDFHTGFSDDGPKFQSFAPPNPWPEDRHLWCQLHGSVLFRVKPEVREIVRYRDRHRAAQCKWVDIDWLSYQDRHLAPLSPLITGLRKADAIQSQPYASYAHALREEAFSCDRWLIIGYGGGDEHINNTLLQARDHWLRSGREHRVVIVGYYPYDKLWEPRLGGLVHASEDYDWTGIGSVMWFFDRELFTRDFALPQRRLTPTGKGTALNLDGVDWAMGEGLPAVLKFLRI
jgi:hypothetical protein